MGRKIGSLSYTVFCNMNNNQFYFSPMRRIFKNASQTSSLDYRLAKIPLPDSSKMRSVVASKNAPMPDSAAN